MGRLVRLWKYTTRRHDTVQGAPVVDNRIFRQGRAGVQGLLPGLEQIRHFQRRFVRHIRGRLDIQAGRGGQLAGQFGVLGRAFPGGLDLHARVRHLQDHALRALQDLPAQEVVHGPVMGNPRGLHLLAQHKAAVSGLPHIAGCLNQCQFGPVFYNPIHAFSSSVFLPLMNRA